ncbi:hypothetical protein Pan216_14560 [Planctomycetes bacterium Pan216]|uniref:Uncharacterized protein n=1 Tax=Kolteria novifilia TaxID=2527975 RepID=A0A518B0U7_9BACT|nr:hypothetical protein Pan216_14560 [Planctomycetes bacterium Pan216]
MKTTYEARLLRVFVGEDLRHEGRPVYELIVERALDHGLAGATVMQGVMGFGHHHKIQTAKILRIAENLPMVVEITDQEDKIEAFFPEVERLLPEGTVTIEKVTVHSFSR